MLGVGAAAPAGAQEADARPPTADAPFVLEASSPETPKELPSPPPRPVTIPASLPPSAPAPPPARLLRDPETASDFQRRGLDDSPLTLHLGGPWSATVYGGERLNLYRDSTQGFGATAHDDPIQAPGTYQGSHGRWFGSGADSRWGAKVSTPTTAPFGGTALAEVGLRPTDVPGGVLQARLFFVAARTPIVDVLFGRYHDLLGWGGRLPFPSTAAALGVPGELYRQRSQLRLSHVFRFEPVDFEIAAAALAPLQSDGYSYERSFGFRLAVNRWTGAADQGGGPAATMPAQIGFSGTRRRFLVTEFSAFPKGSFGVVRDALALNLFVPLIQAHGTDLTNATSFALELSSGSGVADLYSGFTGGGSFPALPNPMNLPAPPVYRPSTPPGIATFDAVGNVQTINWRALVLNVRYHLPVAQGRRVWLEATWSRVTSSDLQRFTPPGGVSSIYPETHYADAAAFVSIFRGLQAALSYQRTKQSYAAGGDHENQRGQLLVAYYF
jgi:hypothetical protein